MLSYDFDIDGVKAAVIATGYYGQDGGFYTINEGGCEPTSLYIFDVKIDGMPNFSVTAEWYDGDKIEAKIRRHLSK